MRRHWGWQRHYSCSVREPSTRLSSCLWADSQPPRPEFGIRVGGGKRKGRVASRRVPRTCESGGLRGRRPVEQQIAKVWRGCQPNFPNFPWIGVNRGSSGSSGRPVPSSGAPTRAASPVLPTPGSEPIRSFHLRWRKRVAERRDAFGFVEGVAELGLREPEQPRSYAKFRGG